MSVLTGGVFTHAGCRSRRAGTTGVTWIAGLAASMATLGFAFADPVRMRVSADYVISARPLKPLEAPQGVTAIAGEIVDLNGVGLRGVVVGEGGMTTTTGADGKFLLTYALPGKGVLQVDGRHAGPLHLDHGFYQVSVQVFPGVTNVMPFKNWLPLIDHAHDVTLTSPTAGPIVITHPAFPGLELRIPAGVVIRDADGAVVTKVGITPLPSDRSPIPFLGTFDRGLNFTIQPGAACLYDAHGGIGTAQLVTPNTAHQLPRARVAFYRYEPDTNGWNPYGEGAVSADGTQVIPDQAAVLTDFSSAECDPLTKSRPDPARRIPVVLPGSVQ